MHEKYNMPAGLFGFYKLTIKEYWFQMLTIFLMNIIYYAGGSIITAVSIKYILGGIETASSLGANVFTAVMPIVLAIFLGHVVILLAEIFADTLKGKYMPVLEQSVSQKMYTYVFNQTYSYFKKFSAGHIAAQTRFISSNFYGLIVSYPRVLIVLLVSLVINFGLLSGVHWSILLVIVICVLFRVIYCASRARRLSDAYVKSARINSKLSGKFVDSLSNVLNIKLFSTQKNEEKYLTKFRNERIRARQISKFNERMFWVPPYSFEKLCTGIILLLCIYLYSKNLIMISDIAFSITSFLGIMRLIRDMTWELPEFLDDYGSAKQAYDELVQPVSVFDHKNAKTMKLNSCHINFNNVSFKYDRDWVIKNMDLCIGHGEHVGIVGLSGSGKTTLVNLLMRLYDVTSGSVTIDGIDVRSVTQDSLRKNIAFIPQESILFNRTLAENISYGTNNATMRDVVAAAKAAKAHKFILRSEDGYKTVVGDRGVKLSGGQRQRITIAHAILKNAPILILDEATSALDSETERDIQESFTRLMRGRTTIAIAHRLSTLKQMDRIIVLDGGRIVEMGSHTELLQRKDGIYRALWSMQSDGFM